MKKGSLIILGIILAFCLSLNFNSTKAETLNSDQTNNNCQVCNEINFNQETTEIKELPLPTETEIPAADLVIDIPPIPLPIPCNLSGTIWNFKYLSKTLKVRICEAERIGGGCLPFPPFTCFGGSVSCKEDGAVYLQDVRRIWAGDEAYGNPGPLAYSARVSCSGSYLIRPIYSPFENECEWQGTFRPTLNNFVSMGGSNKSGDGFSFTANEINPPSINVETSDSFIPAAHKGEGNFTLSAVGFDVSGIKNIKISGCYTVKYFHADQSGPMAISVGDRIITVNRECNTSRCDLAIPYYASGKKVSFNLELKACDNNGNKVQTTYTRSFPDNPGDLTITATDPVQVIYDAPLVKNKNTAFRVKVNSSFPYPVETKIQLNLPNDKWSMTSRSGSFLLGFTPGWTYKDLWGPIKIPANARNYEVMLPIIADWQKELDYDRTGATDREGRMLRGSEIFGIWGLDVRLLPIPSADRVSYSVSIDPENNIRETNEGNNLINSIEYQTVKTRPWRFLYIPFRSDDTGVMCAPTDSMREDGAKRQLEYLLAVFPIAENKIEYGFSYTNFSLACAGDPDGQCEYARAFNVGRGEFLQWMARLALDEGYDFGVAIGCGGGGGAGGSDKAVFVGGNGNEAILAHEFNHAVSPVSDIYVLDCYSSWNESYCERPDGSRFYACWQDYNDEKADRERNGVDPQDGCTIDCGQNETSGCDGACCHARLQPDCTAAGGTNYYAPDLRIDLPASNGFWTNEWLKKEGKQYFMDGPRGDNWMTALSVRASGFSFCAGAGAVDYDGYLNMLTHRRFVSATDPQGLLVSGTINKNGGVTLDPFIYLPETILDIEPQTQGQYYFALLDANQKVLSRSGFDVNFYQSDPNGGPTDQTSFAFRIEWKQGTKFIELQNKDGKTLASRTVSENKPKVKVIAPNGGEIYRVGQNIKATWKASDDDKDDLTYVISLSRDQGKTWQPVDIDFKDNKYKLNTDSWEAGEYLVKIKATDGVNTGQDISDKPFIVKEKKKK